MIKKKIEFSLKDLLLWWFFFSSLIVNLIGCNASTIVQPHQYHLQYPNNIEPVAMVHDKLREHNDRHSYKIVSYDNYIIATLPELVILDVTNPKMPEFISSYDIGWEAVDDMQVIDNRIFLAHQNEGVQVVDMSDPQHLISVGSFHYSYSNPNYIRPATLMIYDDYIYYRLETIGVAGQLSRSEYEWFVLKMESTNIELKSTISALGRPLVTVDKYIYTVLRERSHPNPPKTIFQVVDITSPNAPMITTEIELHLSNLPYDMVVKDSFAYLSVGTGLMIFDVSIPEKPNLIHTTAGIGSFSNLTIQENYIIGDNYVLEVNIANNDVDIKPIGTIQFDTLQSFCNKGKFPSYNIFGKRIKTPCPVGGTGITAHNGYIYNASEKGVIVLEIPP